MLSRIYIAFNAKNWISICQSTFAMVLSHLSTSTLKAAFVWAHLSPVEKDGRQRGRGSVFAVNYLIRLSADWVVEESPLRNSAPNDSVNSKQTANG